MRAPSIEIGTGEKRAARRSHFAARAASIARPSTVSRTSGWARLDSPAPVTMSAPEDVSSSFKPPSPPNVSTTERRAVEAMADKTNAPRLSRSTIA